MHNFQLVTRSLLSLQYPQGALLRYLVINLSITLIEEVLSAMAWFRQLYGGAAR
jgi:hypothetical protein